MKKLLVLCACLPMLAIATVHDFENDPKTCYVFKSGILSHQTACQATGAVGGGLDYVVNEVTYTSNAFGRISIVNNVINHNQKYTTIDNKPANTQYRQLTNYQIVPITAVNTRLNNGEQLLQCIKSQDERLEICTTDLLQI